MGIECGVPHRQNTMARHISYERKTAYYLGMGLMILGGILFASTFVTVLVIMDPIGNIPIFLALTKGQTTAQRHRSALHGSLVAAGVILGFAVGGREVAAIDGVGLKRGADGAEIGGVGGFERAFEGEAEVHDGDERQDRDDCDDDEEFDEREGAFVNPCVLRALVVFGVGEPSCGRAARVRRIVFRSAHVTRIRSIRGRR